MTKTPQNIKPGFIKHKIDPLISVNEETNAKQVFNNKLLSTHSMTPTNATHQNNHYPNNEIRTDTSTYN